MIELMSKPFATLGVGLQWCESRTWEVASTADEADAERRCFSKKLPLCVMHSSTALARFAVCVGDER